MQDVLTVVLLVAVLMVTVTLWWTLRRSQSARDQQLAELAQVREEVGRTQAEAARAREELARVRDESDRDERAELELVRREREEMSELRRSLERREARLTEREDRLEERHRELDTRLEEASRAERELTRQRDELGRADADRLAELERISLLSAEQARAELIADVEHDARRHAVAIARDVEEQARREAEARARYIIVGAIQRLAGEQTAESVVSTVELPGDEMKGRIIGREGRNIRAFEQITGVNVMIDDTPGTVLLSCFDPVRREVGRLTLNELIHDGRIHPARIEESFERNQARIAERCRQAAEEALAEVGITDLHPDLVPVLGALRYRTSYGQNVLKHLVECAHLAGMMAAELGLDVQQCKRAAFLHDIGKALTHQVEGTHAMIGADLARRHGEHPDVVHAIEAHHDEVEPRTVEAIFTQACDAISGGRPGARRESLESYVQRLERLEEIAAAHEGVERVFAMQAGREVRVMVAPEQVDDIGAQLIARDIAKQVEEELTYPGQIRVTVVRESRATETAH